MPNDIYSVDSVRAIDRVAIDNAGIPAYTLMTRAAEAALSEALAAYPAARRWQIICGSGNNAGDGYVVARLAAERGIEVSVIALSAPEALRGAAATAWQDYATAGGVTTTFDGKIDAQALLLVDALLGSGLERDVAGDYARAVDAINQHSAPVLALDVPSGIHADSGAVMGTAVRANRTVTFVGLKTGLFLGSGPGYIGKLSFSGLGIPAECYATQPVELRRIHQRLVASLIPPRPADSHKGDFGHVLIVGGGPGMSGAVRLCGEASLRSGAGVVSVATHPANHAIVAAGQAELMCHGVASAEELGPLLARATTVALGPGLGTGDWSRAMFEAVLGCGLPLIVDADALNLLCESDTRCADWVLTPHPGEAGRLLGRSSIAVQADRRAALSDLAARYGGTIVLKGAGSLVSAGDGPDWLCSAGNPGMAAPGMGDVLTGIIAALRAQGLSPAMAAMAGVYVHARAGDAAVLSGERGLLASDLIQELRSWVNF